MPGCSASATHRRAKQVESGPDLSPGYKLVASARLVLRACGRVTQAHKEDTMSTRAQRNVTDEQRAARRRERIEQLRRATEMLLTSEGWQRWLQTRSRFHRYSLNNTMLIALQCPSATHVAGFRKWLELGRCVRKGEKAIRIFAPVRYRRAADESDEQPAGTENEPQVTGFRLACVFDVSQTEPLPGVDPAPLDPPRAPIEGDTHCHLLEPLVRHAGQLGFEVRFEPLGARDGFCSTRDARIGIDSALSVNAQVATLVHELAHAHGIDYQTYSRGEAELIVESVAYVVCAGVGLDTSSDSIPYLAGWSGEDAGERIALVSGKVDEIARTIEQALAPPTNASE
jgi:hypothetical protein